MKKILFASLFPVLIGSAFQAFAGAPAPATVDGGKINFTGSIVAAPCAVDNDSGGQIIRLGQVAANKLVGAGSTSASVPFAIKLTGCDLSAKDASDATKSASYTKASITFSGNTVSGNTKALALSGNMGGETVAQNVGIQILQNGTAVAVDGSTATAQSKIHAGQNEIPFSANYVQVGAESDEVVAGLANASVNFMVSYE